MNNIILIVEHRKLMNEIKKLKKIKPINYKKQKPNPPVFKCRRGNYIVHF